MATSEDEVIAEARRVLQAWADHIQPVLTHTSEQLTAVWSYMEQVIRAWVAAGDLLTDAHWQEEPAATLERYLMLKQFLADLDAEWQGSSEEGVDHE
jgi:hypothetical protein